MTQLSVVMPIYNSWQHLRCAIDSIRSQTFRDWELVCIDDGSDDDTLEILRYYESLDERIHCYSRPHAGIVASLNYGVSLCRSPFIARMDADDIALPDRFATQLEWFESHPDVSLLGSAYDVIDGAGRTTKTVGLPVSNAEIAIALRNGNCVAHPTVMMRASVLRQLEGPYRESFLYAEDYDLWVRLAERFVIMNHPRVLLQYRRDLSRVNPKRLTLESLSTLGVQASSRHRLRGLDDPADSWRYRNLSQPQEEMTECERYRQHFGITQAQHLDLTRRKLLSDAREAKKQGLDEAVSTLREHAIQLKSSSKSWTSSFDLHWRLLKLRMTQKRFCHSKS